MLELVDAVAEHVVGVTHHEAPRGVSRLLDGVAHGALVALYVELNAGGEEQVRAGLGGIGPVVHQGQVGPPERVEVSCRWRAGVRGGLGGCGLLLGAERAGLTLRVPRSPGWRLRRRG